MGVPVTDQQDLSPTTLSTLGQLQTCKGRVGACVALAPQSSSDLARPSYRPQARSPVNGYTRRSQLRAFEALRSHRRPLRSASVCSAG